MNFNAEHQSKHCPLAYQDGVHMRLPLTPLRGELDVELGPDLLQGGDELVHQPVVVQPAGVKRSRSVPRGTVG